MTELEQYRPAGELQVAYADVAVQRLGDWARSADAAFGIAKRLVESSFVPVAFRGKPVEATAAILAGSEVGISPMSALRAFDIISGQAAARAITLRAIVQSQGHEMVLVESTNTRCRMRGRRRGSAEWQSVTWTIDRAKDLGLVGKDNWKKQPGAMLVARATSELARLVASDAILGLAYSAEEVRDGSVVDDGGDVAVEAKASGTRRMSRLRPVEPTEPAPDEPEPAAAAPDEPTPAPITKPQLAKLQAHYGDVDRDERLAEASSVLGFDVASFSDLTKDQASRLIEWIDEPTADGAS